MMARKIVCNMCGKPIQNDEGGDFALDWAFGYGSERDGDVIEASFCSRCADKITSMIDAQCDITITNE